MLDAWTFAANIWTMNLRGPFLHGILEWISGMHLYNILPWTPTLQAQRAYSEGRFCMEFWNGNNVLHMVRRRGLWKLHCIFALLMGLHG